MRVLTVSSLKLFKDFAIFISIVEFMRFRKTVLQEDLKSFGRGYKVTAPELWQAGVVFASPHSGSLYPPALLKRSKLSPDQLRRNEDIFVERLFSSVVEAGAPLIEALFPRAMVDVNRADTELPDHWSHIRPMTDPSVSTPRAAAGLGVVPTYLSEDMPIYKNLPSETDVKRRIERLYTPYHDALRALLEQAKHKFGRALLVDCHSMPGFAPMGSRRPDIILGDRFGTSCHPDTLAHFKDLFSRSGYSVGINYPYAGGFTTSNYGQPSDGIEAIQIEINRDLYVNPVTLREKPGFTTLKENIRNIAHEIIKTASPQNLAAQ